MYGESTALRERAGRPALRAPRLLALGAAAVAVSVSAGCGHATPAATSTPAPSATSTSASTSTSTSVSSAAPAPSVAAVAPAAATTTAGAQPSVAPQAADPAGAVPGQPAAAATRAAVPLTALADFGTGVTAKITGSRLVTSAGKGPGEIAGQPSVAFTVALTNGSGRPVDLTAVTVSGFYGAQSTPASPTNGPPTAPFTGTLATRGATSGTYTFLVPPEGRSDVQLQISYLADQPTVVLRGAVR